MSSEAEREVRDAVVARLRVLLPKARIVHELNIAGQGSSRIDVAAVGPDYLVGIEIKSEKDKLTRLADQWEAFNKVCDVVIVAAHRKHFEEWRNSHARADVKPTLSLRHDMAGDWKLSNHLWCYPSEQELHLRGQYEKHGWNIGRRASFSTSKPKPPRAVTMLEMLWRDELASVCYRHGFAATSRSTRPTMIYDLAMGLTGREIKQAVCTELRGRVFAEADPPMGDAVPDSAPQPELFMEVSS